MLTDASDEAALRIAHFIVTQLDYQGPVTDLVGSQPVRLTEAIDSLALMELAAFIEDAFGVQIKDDEILPENFATVADVVRLLRGKGALAAPSATDDEERKRSRS
jgi:acyl carrier protein